MTKDPEGVTSWIRVVPVTERTDKFLLEFFAHKVFAAKHGIY